MSDLIRRSDAIKALRKLGHEVVVIDKVCSLGVAQEFIDAIRGIPTADRPSAVDLSSVYSTAYKSGYEKGKADEKRWWSEHCAKCTDADRPQGEWIDAEIPLESGGSMPIQACNLCKTFYPLAYTGGGHRFCPNCGARMKGADDE